jgi:hypothetical protein
MGRGLDGYLISVHWRCAVLKAREEGSPLVSGGYGEGETPLPIPNRAVKPLSADGTWLARAWESRSPPVLIATPFVSEETRGVVSRIGMLVASFRVPERSRDRFAHRNACTCW